MHNGLKKISLISETLESNKLSAECTRKFAMAVKDFEVGVSGII